MRVSTFIARLTLITGTALLTQAAIARPQLPIDIAEMQARVAERFAEIDEDGSGDVSLAEFEAHAGERALAPRHDRKGMRGNARAPRSSRHAFGGRTAPEAPTEDEIFEALDSNDDGVLSPEEASQENREATRRALRASRAFAQLDQDGSGTLTADEMPNPAERLRSIDTDGDGIVSREELREARRTAGGRRG